MARQEFGFIDWQPREKTRELIEMVLAILEEYKSELPLTLRQIFYRAVAKYLLEKTDKAYNRLGEHCATARRAGLLPFEAIRDDTGVVSNPFDFKDPSDFWTYVGSLADDYVRERFAGQARQLIVMPEAAGMVPQLERVCIPLGVPVRSGGGYDSVSFKYNLARVIDASDRPVTVLHLGDFDPSGENMFDNLRQDVGTFVVQVRAGIDPSDGDDGVTIAELTRVAMEKEKPWVEFVRLAVTPAQIRQFNLPTAPAKKTDTRTKAFEQKHGDNGTVQLEALPPDEVAAIVRAAIVTRTDADVFNDNLALERQERAEIRRAVNGLL
jgi:hypothetical protein